MQQQESATELPRTTSLRCFNNFSPKFIAYKNVFGTGIPYMLIYGNLLAVFSLQSSLNDDQGLGLATLAIINVVTLLNGFFVSSIIKLFGTKNTFILASSVSVVFLIANFYPRWYTLVPGAIVLGFVRPQLLASVNVHLTTLAIKYAPDLNENPDHLIAFFTGTVTMFFKLGYFPGNLATTTILFSERHSSGSEIIDTSLGNVCNNTEVETLNPTYVYILMSTFVLLTIVAIVISFIFMDHLGTEFKFQSCRGVLTEYIKEPFMSTLIMFTDWKIYMLLVMMLTDGYITSITVGKISKHLVTDCIGVHWVGLFSMTYGVSSAISGLVTGRLVKWIPQFMMVYFFSVLILATVLFLIIWGEREPSYIVAFLPIAIMGLSEGMWNSVPPTLTGILFPGKKAPAYGVLRQGLAAGFILGFTVALFAEIHICLWLEVVLIIVSLITYSILIFITQTKEQLLPCCYREKPARRGTINHNNDNDKKEIKLQIH